MNLKTTKCLGAGNIAEYCGVPTATVYQWIYRHGPDTDSKNPLPIPVVAVVQGRKKGSDGNSVTYGWAPTQLADIREWYANFKGWDDREAAHHWVEVDAQLKEKEREAATRR